MKSHGVTVTFCLRKCGVNRTNYLMHLYNSTQTSTSPGSSQLRYSMTDSTPSHDHCFSTIDNSIEKVKSEKIE
jgi:hypothetical protein